MPEQAIELRELWLRLGALNWEDDEAKQLRAQIKKIYGVSKWSEVLNHPKQPESQIELSREVEEACKEYAYDFVTCNYELPEATEELQKFARAIIAQVREEMKQPPNS